MILCLDIAFANLGWSIVKNSTPVAWGTVRTEKSKKRGTRVSDDKATRAAYTASALSDIILEHKPLGIIGELPSGSQNANAASLLGYASGIVVGVAAVHRIPCEWISEGDAKKAALGKRTSTKEESMEWVRAKWPGIAFPAAKTHFEHVADSLMAYYGLRDGVLARAFG